VLVGISIHPYIQLEDHLHLESIPSRSLVEHQRRRLKLDNLQGELKRLKRPKFDVGHMNGEDDESWLLGTRKYF
jgi:hypothetical protein